MNTKKIRQLCCCFFIFTFFLNANLTTATESKKQKQKQNEIETVQSKEFSYQFGPVPNFVNRLSGLPSEEPRRADQGDSFYVFLDKQLSLLSDVPEQYVHYESKPLTASALPNTSQVTITFNPAYEKLKLHGIHVWRNGKSIDLTHEVKLELLRREDNLDKSIYDGNVTAVGVLPDIRVNDAIEVEYTISGSNPIFGKRYSSYFSITRELPVNHYRLIATTPEARPLKIRAPSNVTVKEIKSNGNNQYLIQADDVKSLKQEDKTPEWYQPFQLIHLSEYKDWSEVSAWANDLFKVNEELSPEIQAQLQTWKDAHLTKDQLTVEALRWVQSQIRYFGIELGTNSHLPSPPNKTFERKYGDCKDKSLLLSVLLKSLGIEATPTLSALDFRRSPDSLIPSTAIFSHVIVRAVVDGKTYWLDPTLPPQFGKLDSLGVIDYGNVLVLGENSTQLSYATYPQDYESHYQVLNHFKLIAYKQPIELSSEIKLGFNLSELFRTLHEKQSQDDFNKSTQNMILSTYPKAKPVGDVVFVDDKINNLVTLTSKFTIDDFMKYEPGRLSSMFVAQESLSQASLPSVSQRLSPYALPAHEHLTETVEFDFPEVPSIKPNKSENSKKGEYWNLTTNFNISNNKLLIIWNLKANKEAVPSQKISEYSTETKEIRNKMFGALTLPLETITDGDKKDIFKVLQPLERKYGNSSSDRVKAEMKGAVNLVVLSHDIASGKLSDKQLAEAYSLRSVIFDNQGDVQHALEDIHAAKKLDPDNTNYITTEAETLLGDGQFNEANTLYEQVIKMDKAPDTNLGDALRGYGQSLYYSGQNKIARERLNQATQEASGEGIIYAAIWRYMADSKENISDAGNSLQLTLNGIQDQAWPYQVGQMLLGKITPDQLIAFANSKDKGVQEDQYCEAYFYIGKKYSIESNKEKAKEYFQKSIDQGVLPFSENNFSLYELGKKKAPKSNSSFGLF